MGETIRVNGKDIPIEDFNGVDDELLTAAYRRHNQARANGSSYCGVHGGTMAIGTPRHRKHKGDNVAGVRIK